MLNQNDRRRLEAIERQLEIDDPEFARRLSGWSPAAPPRWRSWPVLLLVVSGLGVLLSVVALSPALFLLCLCGCAGGWIWLVQRNQKDAGPDGRDSRGSGWYSG
jgi:hypothetical protein